MPDSFDHSTLDLSRAVSDFYDARRRASLERLLAQLRRRPAELLSYDEVRVKLRAVQGSLAVLEIIPLEKIVGSVNRYQDFSRSFLPRTEADSQRWARVRLAMESSTGVPPIEAYKIGGVYFVADGNHRVSVARSLGAGSIEGYVTTVSTRVPLSPGDSPDDLILKSEYADFLERTRLDETRPGANLMVTAPGQFPRLLEHISVHQYFMGQARGEAVPLPEAAADWYDSVYLPIEKVIRSRALLRDFPGRTEADLYLWLMEYRSQLSGGGMGWEVDPEAASEDLAERYSPVGRRRLSRLVRRVTGWITPRPLEPGPPPGVWRERAPHRGDRLFDDILVALPAGGSVDALSTAIEIARRENARLTGLHVVESDEDRFSPRLAALREEFHDRCSEAGLFSRLLVEKGSPGDVLVRFSYWIDLTIFRLNHPPPSGSIRRLNSGARLLIRRAGGPLLALAGETALSSAVLAFGPNRRALEALYVAAYLSGRWRTRLTVVTVDRSGQKLLDQARAYLEQRQVQADYVLDVGESPGEGRARALLDAAQARAADLVIMGGYESGPLRESLSGSTVDRVLRRAGIPVLICQ